MYVEPSCSSRKRSGRKRSGCGKMLASSCISVTAGISVTPAGSRQPPSVTGAFSWRSTAGITGRTRSVSLTTASRYASSPSRARASAAGLRSSRSNAHARPVVVVSCPASSSVISWSRSSPSSISPARTSAESTSSRSARPGSARRAAISSSSSRFASATRCRCRRQWPTYLRPGTTHISITVGSISTVFGSTSRNACVRAGSLTPITASRITSSVIARMRACSANGRPSGQPSTSAATIRSIVSP